MNKSNKKGFTLIELLVVIAIIGLLSTLSVVALNSARQKSRDSKRVSDVKQVQTALELYYADNNGYPVEATAIELGTDATVLCGDTGAAGFVATCTAAGTYMGLVPTAPEPWDGTCSEETNAYSYQASTAATYQIDFCIGGSVGDLTAGALRATPAGIQNVVTP